MKLPSFVSDLSLPPLEYHQRLREWSKEMRTSSPISWDEDNASWLAFRYEDVVRVQNDYATFSSENTVKNEEAVEGRPSSSSIISMDPPEHRQLRSLVTQAFSARTIAGMSPQIESVVNDLLDRALPNGQMDWMAEMANPLPIVVIANMLGLPRDEWPQFKTWTDAIINRSPEREEARQNFAQYFVQAIEERRRHPGQDILSLLIAAEVEGERLDFETLMSFCFTLFIAGNITTTNVLGSAMLCLDANPEEFQRLRQHPEMIASAVEEAIRYMPPFRAGPNDLIEGRVAKTDVHLSQQLIRKGEKVQMNRLSANFDELQFPDPDRFDIARNPNRHQSFGHGIHFCLGAPLARLEIKIALEAMLKKFREVHVVHDQKIEQAQSSLIFGVQQLPLVFQAA